MSGIIYNVELNTQGDATGTYSFMGEIKDWGTLIDTDYDSYSVRYSCVTSEDGTRKEEHADIWVRDPDAGHSDLLQSS